MIAVLVRRCSCSFAGGLELAIFDEVKLAPVWLG
jgi:hypothetical protein